MAALAVWILTRGQALACAVCFSPEMNGNIRNAYLMATAVMLGLALAIMAGVFYIARHYRDQTRQP
ncbi:MAG: hypothetical protein OEW39_13925 [Deltaproteobacteria bacterium]|nr:hypothetical protein [Deltaproteobacteria bacterium]